MTRLLKLKNPRKDPQQYRLYAFENKYVSSESKIPAQAVSQEAQRIWALGQLYFGFTKACPKVSLNPRRTCVSVYYFARHCVELVKAPAICPVLLCHELAHGMFYAIHGKTAFSMQVHGPEFCAIAFRLYEKFLGFNYENLCQEAFNQFGLSVEGFTPAKNSSATPLMLLPKPTRDSQKQSFLDAFNKLQSKYPQLKTMDQGSAWSIIGNYFAEIGLKFNKEPVIFQNLAKPNYKLIEVAKSWVSVRSDVAPKQSKAYKLYGFAGFAEIGLTTDKAGYPTHNPQFLGRFCAYLAMELNLPYEQMVKQMTAFGLKVKFCDISQMIVETYQQKEKSQELMAAKK